MEAFLTDMIRAAAESPLLVVLAVAAATLVLEDVATAGSALLAAEGIIPVPAAILGLFIGITVGDLGLFAIGRLARHWAWLQNRIGEERLEKGRAWLAQRLLPAIFVARATPGLRVPTYISCGYFGIRLRAFAMIAVVAVGIWSVAAFSLVYVYGHAAQAWLGPASWIAAVFLIAVVIAWPFLLRRRLSS